MERLKVVNETRGCELGSRIGLADGWWSRLRGLIGRAPLERGEGLLLMSTRGVHMYGVTYPIDVAFVDRDRKIVALYRELAPGARTRWHGEARAALELPAGELAESGTGIGDRLRWTPTEEER